MSQISELVLGRTLWTSSTHVIQFILTVFSSSPCWSWQNLLLADRSRHLFGNKLLWSHSFVQKRRLWPVEFRWLSLYRLSKSSLAISCPRDFVNRSVRWKLKLTPPPKKGEVILNQTNTFLGVRIRRTQSFWFRRIRNVSYHQKIRRPMFLSS